MISSTISFSSLTPSSPPPPHTYHLHPEYLVPQIFISHSSSFFQRRARRRVEGWELVGQSQATTISREVLPHVGPRWTTKCFAINSVLAPDPLRPHKYFSRATKNIFIASLHIFILGREYLSVWNFKAKYYEPMWNIFTFEANNECWINTVDDYLGKPFN